jgi:hypothetical protein
VEGMPSVKQQILREIEPQLSPLIRALLKYQLLLPASAVVKADRVRAQIRRSLADAFAQVDALAWPATPAPSPPIADPVVELPSGRYPADFANVRLGGLGNLAGVPAASVPCGLTGERLPIGLQMLAPWREDERLLDLAELLEQTTDRRFVDAAPPIAQTAAAELFVAVRYAPAFEVVGRQLDLHTVSAQDPDVVAAHLPGDVAEHHVVVVELHAEHRVRQRLDDLALHLDLLFFAHRARKLPAALAPNPRYGGAGAPEPVSSAPPGRPAARFGAPLSHPRPVHTR